MRMSLRAAVFIVALGVAFSSVAIGLAQTRPILGGYKTVSTDDTGVKEAAEFAVSSRSENENVSLKLISIVHAERQSVQGVNYRLCLQVGIDDEGDDSDETQEVKVVVYNYQNTSTLKSWEVAECGGH